jgi:uncharacterized membrane protein
MKYVTVGSIMATLPFLICFVMGHGLGFQTLGGEPLIIASVLTFIGLALVFSATLYGDSQE